MHVHYHIFVQMGNGSNASLMIIKQTKAKNALIIVLSVKNNNVQETWNKRIISKQTSKQDASIVLRHHKYEIVENSDILNVRKRISKMFVLFGICIVLLYCNDILMLLNASYAPVFQSTEQCTLYSTVEIHFKWKINSLNINNKKELKMNT